MPLFEFESPGASGKIITITERPSNAHSRNPNVNIELPDAAETYCTPSSS
jgi:hypothetical protein